MQVTCIQGETGCGKSSMVPQFLVEEAQSRGERVKVCVCVREREGEKVCVSERGRVRKRV